MVICANAMRGTEYNNIRYVGSGSSGTSTYCGSLQSEPTGGEGACTVSKKRMKRIGKVIVRLLVPSTLLVKKCWIDFQSSLLSSFFFIENTLRY